MGQNPQQDSSQHTTGEIARVGDTGAQDPYAARLSDEVRPVYLSMPGDPALYAEIRLLRTVIAVLCEGLPGSAGMLLKAVAALIRVLVLHIKTADRLTAMDDALAEWRAGILRGSPWEQP